MPAKRDELHAREKRWGVGGGAPTPRVVGLGEGLVVSVLSAVCAGV
jgi:hypothetical protein